MDADLVKHIWGFTIWRVYPVAIPIQLRNRSWNEPRNMRKQKAKLIFLSTKLIHLLSEQSLFLNHFPVRVFRGFNFRFQVQ